MDKKEGFLKYKRNEPLTEAADKRIENYKEFTYPFKEDESIRQAARCMDCGVPFCHQGCPLGNEIPEFNDAVYNKDWKLAFEVLSSTNNFPEFTGRICPAPCEASCVLNINKDPVTIELIEKQIAEEAFNNGFIKPETPVKRTCKKVAIVGSGPAGLAAAVQLNTAGHWVTVFEKDENPGGLLRYGIPDFKLEKWVVQRRIELMKKEGIKFETGVEIGVNIEAKSLIDDFDSILLCCGALDPRDLKIPGRNLDGIHFAMDYLVQQNKRLEGKEFSEEERIMATNRNVIVLGGGDTGSDCIGTANRQKAKSIKQINYHEKPPLARTAENPWPEWPAIFTSSSSHEEGCDRRFGLLTKSFIGDVNNRVEGIEVVEVSWEKGTRNFKEIPGTSRVINTELVLIAIGFQGTEKSLPEQLGLDLDNRGRIKTSRYQTEKEKIFAAGDMRRGQSLVVWAISEGREAAIAVDKYLMGESVLPSKNNSIQSLA